MSGYQTGYTAFLIAPFTNGIDTDLQPWMIPQDAFTNIENGHVHHGVVEKRDGSTKQGDIVHKNGTDWDIVSTSGLVNPITVTVTNATGLTTGDTVEIRDVGGMTELNGNKYTITVVGNTLTLNNVDGTDFTAYTAGGGVYLIPEDRVMGLQRYIDSSNVKEGLAFDTKRVCKYNSSDLEYDPIDTADIMDGDDTDYIWAVNWASVASTTASSLYRMYFTNGKLLSGGLNGIRYYEGGTTTTSFAPTINGVTAINGCKLLFAYNERLLLLHTFEGSNVYPQRVRWCQAQGPSIADGWDDNVAGKGGYVDAPTGEQIISAQFVQNSIIVFFTSSVWTLRATADPALPFRWDKVNDFRSCDGKMTSTTFDRGVLAVGNRGITITSGVETQRIDGRIENFVSDSINNSEFGKVFALRSFEKRRMWLLYPSKESTDADSALIYDEESQAFSKYKVNLNVLGYGGASSDKGINDFGDKTLSEFDEETISSFFFDSGSEVLIGGDRSGRIFFLETGGVDEEVLFESDIANVSQANPAVIEMTDDIGIVDGDIISISGIAVGSMVELNDRFFTVTSKTSNTFSLLGEDSTGYAAYVGGSGGTIRTTKSNNYEFTAESAAWNPYMKEGRKSQMGYIDFFLDTNALTNLTVEFFTNNNFSPYSTKVINLLPDLRERAEVTGVTNASPGVVESPSHGLITGDIVYLYNVEGMEEINDRPLTVTVVDSGHFSIGVNTTDFGVYTTGGVVTELPFESTKAWKRVFAGGTGYQHKIKLTSSGKDHGLKINAFMPWFRARSHRPI